jgi:hypothetical protein
VRVRVCRVCERARARARARVRVSCGVCAVWRVRVFSNMFQQMVISLLEISWKCAEMK